MDSPQAYINNKQIGGKHYQIPIQPIEYITKNKLPYSVLTRIGNLCSANTVSFYVIFHGRTLFIYTIYQSKQKKSDYIFGNTCFNSNFTELILDISESC